MFYDFLQIEDFVGADMAKKFLHMGFTRARRYANHKDGKKYAVDGTILPQESDALTSVKAQSAKVFYKAWKEARENKKYLYLKDRHRVVEKDESRRLSLVETSIYKRKTNSVCSGDM
jgi:predicted transposase YdaD